MMKHHRRCIRGVLACGHPLFLRGENRRRCMLRLAAGGGRTPCLLPWSAGYLRLGLDRGCCNFSLRVAYTMPKPQGVRINGKEERGEAGAWAQPFSPFDVGGPQERQSEEKCSSTKGSSPEKPPSPKKPFRRHGRTDFKVHAPASRLGSPATARTGGSNLLPLLAPNLKI